MALRTTLTKDLTVCFSWTPRSTARTWAARGEALAMRIRVRVVPTAGRAAALLHFRDGTFRVSFIVRISTNPHVSTPTQTHIHKIDNMVNEMYANGALVMSNLVS